MSDPKLRAPGLQVLFQPDARLLVRSMVAGTGARVPLQAIGVLAFCGEPRTVEDCEAALGPNGRVLFEALAGAGLLVDPSAAGGTPVFFENFAAVEVHRRMLADAVRVEAYWRALSTVVRPGMAVCDAGTGSGLLACMAAALGARVVYAVERSDLADLARDVIGASGLEDRVRVVRGDFGEVELPEKVDVIVTETFGALALAEGAAPDLHACAARNLKEGGVLVPRGLALWLAPVGDRALYDETVGVFGQVHGVDLAPLRALAARRSRNRDVPMEALLAPGQAWSTPWWPREAGASGTVTFGDLSGGELTGLCGWFVLDLVPGVVLPTGPLDPVTHWGQTYLPLEPVPVPPGATLRVEAELSPAEEDRRTMHLRGNFSCGPARGTLDHRVR